jgi:hypothetical protein
MTDDVAAGRGDRAPGDGDALQPFSFGLPGNTKNLTDFFLQARCARREGLVLSRTVTALFGACIE